MKKRHSVDVPGHVRKQLGSPGAALAVTLKAEGRLHQRPDLLGEETGVLVEAFQLLTIAAGELRLVVPRIDVAGTAVHEQPDNRLRLRDEVRRFRGERVGRSGNRGRAAKESLLIEQAGE